MSYVFLIIDGRGRGSWLTPSLVVAIFALLFTVGSFWWIQVRRGLLRAYTSHVYSGGFTPAKIVLVLPLVVHNPAPAPIIVTDLRLRVDTPRGTAVREPALPIYLSWIASHASVYPQNESRVYAAPFVVAGRTAIEEFISVTAP
ncbi:hypothetical protein ACIA49_37160 [Kribbella sp. NPDC051587]|uniref:hypothetical protein n=1 Tax=Kribbella sp. NPDC051587 TaxID=3364119 RepID=UPI0037971539